jgi:hypothetical protein
VGRLVEDFYVLGQSDVRVGGGGEEELEGHEEGPGAFY